MKFDSASDIATTELRVCCRYYSGGGINSLFTGQACRLKPLFLFQKFTFGRFSLILKQVTETILLLFLFIFRCLQETQIKTVL